MEHLNELTRTESEFEPKFDPILFATHTHTLQGNLEAREQDSNNNENVLVEHRTQRIWQRPILRGTSDPGFVIYRYIYT